MVNEVELIGKVVSPLNKYIKDGITYISFKIETRSKYEMNPTIIKCQLAGQLIDEAEKNIKLNITIGLKAHLIMEDELIEVLVDEINY